MKCEEDFEKAKATIEAQAREYYNQRLSELETHHDKLGVERQKRRDAEVARQVEMMNEAKVRFLEEQEAMKTAMERQAQAKYQQIKNEAHERLCRREREMEEDKQRTITAMEDAHDKAVEAAAAEAASAAAAERARRFDFEEAQVSGRPSSRTQTQHATHTLTHPSHSFFFFLSFSFSLFLSLSLFLFLSLSPSLSSFPSLFLFCITQRARTEKAIREALRTADDATSTLRQKFAKEREGLREEMLQQEHAFKQALGEQEDRVACLEEEVGRLQAARAAAVAEIEAKTKQLGVAHGDISRFEREISDLNEEVCRIQSEAEVRLQEKQEAMEGRERALKAELNSRLGSITKVMQDLGQQMV